MKCGQVVHSNNLYSVDKQSIVIIDKGVDKQSIIIINEVSKSGPL